MTNRCVWTLSMIHDGQDEMRACSHAVPQVHLLAARSQVATARAN